MNEARGRIRLGVVAALLLGCNEDHGFRSTFPQARSPLYAPPESHLISGEPLGVAAADLDGDGRVDLAALSGAGSLDVLLARATGGFEALIPLPLGGGDKLAAGDLDGDARPDFAITDAFNEVVTVLLNVGGGGFEAPAPQAVEGSPTAAAIADFDSNGMNDIAVSFVDDAGSEIGLLLGIGSGEFQSGTPSMTVISPSAMAVGDLDGDSHPDVALTHRLDPVCHDGPLVTMLFGTDTGVLGALRTHGEAAYATSIALADLDLDGVLDVVVGRGLNPAPCQANLVIAGATAGGECDEKGVVLLGVGDGTLQGAPCVPLGFDVRDLAIADLDDDGAPELVGANGFTGRVSIARGAGDGSFPETSDYITGSGPTAIDLARIDEDSDLDLLVAHAGWGAITVVSGVGDGTFEAPLALRTGFGVMSVVAEDATADGLPDLIAFGSNDGKNRALAILSGLGSGRFQSSGIRDVELRPFDPFHLAATDLDADLTVDLVALGSPSSPGVWTLRGDVGDPFHDVQDLELPVPLAGPFIVGDLDGDAPLDLVASMPELSVLLGSVQQALIPGAPIPSAEPAESIGIGDLDADGLADIAACGYGGVLAIHPGVGGGAFAPATLHPLETTCPAFFSRLAVGDVNGDGLMDAAVISDLFDDCSTELVLHLGSSDGKLRALDPAPIGPLTVTGATIADIDGDGHADLVLPAVDLGGLLLLPGRGDGNFDEPSFYFVGESPGAAQVRDLDLDGDLDLVTLAGTLVVLGGFR